MSVKKLNFAHTHTKTPAKLSYLNKYPELLCGPSCDHSQKQTITMENSPWGKKEYFRVYCNTMNCELDVLSGPPDFAIAAHQASCQHFYSVAPPPAGPAG